MKFYLQSHKSKQQRTTWSLIPIRSLLQIAHSAPNLLMLCDSFLCMTANICKESHVRLLRLRLLWQVKYKICVLEERSFRASNALAAFRSSR